MKVQLRPKPRESSSIFYDSGESRVLVFGGWANNWLSDLWSLNVSTITGPPYAIFKLKPALGPLTGKTKIKIEGDGFKDTNISVKFSGGKMEKEVNGQFISEKEIVCETPTFDHPRSVEVTVCMNKGDFTITKSSFTYYLNTKAEKTIAYGSGLLFENLVGVKTTIVV
jgi:dynein heavy chain